MDLAIGNERTLFEQGQEYLDFCSLWGCHDEAGPGHAFPHPVLAATLLIPTSMLPSVELPKDSIDKVQQNPEEENVSNQK